MDYDDYKNVEPQKKMRKREKPQKKWSEKENSLILEYLLENVEIELYYRKMIERTQIDATPEMLRCKVRYWKQTFNKAEQWRKSTGAGLDVGDEASTINEKLLKICPSYDRFSLLFDM
ncbi:hypothetical protein EVAR_72884_1 [Eumeta japonica]|uniref:Regulatory protein zeste n=1 Tax=Eumeta variegata TaxID=151549 RepID=A0A4C2AGR9_EUMVA|nr:hypothetical protein EVAR_72884_1 [Eumeta japonica]